MSRNVEIKARVDAPEWARMHQVAASQAERGPIQLYQVDTYFRTAVGRLKLREFENGAAELIFYHRPDQAEAKLSDYRLIPCPAPVELKATLTQTNGVLVVVEKRRVVYFGGPTRIHLDDVTGLGKFVELEVVVERSRSQESEVAADSNREAVGEGASPEDSLAAAQQIAARWMTALGIESGSLIKGSYSDLIRQG